MTLGPFVEDFGAVGNDPGNGTGTDDRPAFLAAFSSSRAVFLSPAKTYRIHGPLYLPRFQQLIGLGMRSASEYWVETGQTGASRIVFTGGGDACFLNADPSNMLSHGGMRGFVMRAVGTYSRMMYFRDLLDWHMSDIGMQTDNLNTAGIVTEKISSDNPSWTNSLVNVSIRLPDASNCRTLNMDWSDSAIDRSQFTGGLGVLDRGYGTRFTSNQIERSKYAGLTLMKTSVTGKRNTQIIGNSLDANKTHGILFDMSGGQNPKFNVPVIGNVFRTEDPNTGAIGASSIALINSSAQTCSIGKVLGNEELNSGVPNYASIGPWTIPSTF